MAVNVQERRRRGQSLFSGFTPVTESPELEVLSSMSPRSSTKRKAKVQNVSGEQERATGILRSSSSPLIYYGGEQVTFNRMQPMSVMNQSPGNSRGTGSYSQIAGRSAYSNIHIPPARSNSHQHLHSFSRRSPSGSPLQPSVGQRHSFAQSQPHYYTASPYSGSDADDDDNETQDERPLVLRSRSGSGNTTSRKVYNNYNPILPLSPPIAPLTMARHPETVSVQDVSRSKSTVIPNGSLSSLGKAAGNGKTSGDEGFSHPIIIAISGNSIQWKVNMDRISPLLFQCLCTLAAIPALTETFSLLMRMYKPQANTHGNTRLDYIAAAAWSILTAHQCFAFTTGLLTRWRRYYPLPSTLIRLVALQGICWPATFYTLRLLQYDGIQRPLVCWSVIGTTTCITRSIQMWVTSNIDEWNRDPDGAPQYGAHTVASIALGFGEKKVLSTGNETEREDVARKQLPHAPLERSRSLSSGTLSKKTRKWDWNEVVWKCAFPAGVCYFFMAWALLLSREMDRGMRCDSG